MKKVIAVLLSVTLLFSVCGISFSASALAFPKVTDKINQDSNRCFTNAPDDGLIYADILYDVTPMTADEKDDYVYEKCGIRSSDLVSGKNLTEEEKEIRKQNIILYYSELRNLEEEQANANAEPFLEQMGIVIQSSGDTPIYHNRRIVKSDTGMFICLTKQEILAAEQLDYVEGIICYRRVYNDNKTTILFENTRKWDKIYVYGWDSNGNENCGAYPGKEVTEKITDEDGDEYYIVDIPLDSEGILLNNGGNEISADMNRSVFLYGNYYAYRLKSAKDNQDHYYFEGYGKENPDPSTDPTGQPVAVDRDSFTFTVPFGWDEANVYALDADGKELCGAFPGNQKADFVLNGYGETEFTVNIPKGATSITLSNNKGARTVAITDFAYYANYDLTDKTDSSGYYIVKGTNPAPASFMLLDNYGWKQAYIYALDKDGKELNGAFPGVQAERFLDYGGFQFRIPVPDGAESIVVSNGKGQKTEKITDFSVYYGYSLSTKNADGDYKLNEYWGYLPSPASGDTDDPWFEPDRQLRITDNFGWGTGYLYAWDEDGNELTGAWPGKKTNTTENDYGETIFICNIPNNAVGIIINDGNGNQSTDITDFTCDGYWFDGTKDDWGHYIPIGYGNSSSDPVVDPGADPGCVDTIWFYNTLDFENVYEYVWDTEGNSSFGDWPGKPLTQKEYDPDLGCDKYLVELPNNAEGIIINDGNGRQTEDIVGDLKNHSFKLKNEINELGHYLITPIYENLDPTQQTTTTRPAETKPSADPGCGPLAGTVYITDNFVWGEGYMYTWDAEGNSLTGEWPGTPVETVTNIYGETVFVCNYPIGTEGIIINNGNGDQSDDIYVSDDYNCYWFDGTKNEMGHYIPTGVYIEDIYSYLLDNEPTVKPEPTTAHNDTPAEIKIRDTLGWGTAYMYSWDSEGYEYSGAWPGTVVETTTNGIGENIFICNVPENVEGIVINDGKSNQSTDITEFYSDDYYWFDGSTDEMGHYIPVYGNNHHFPSNKPVLRITDNFGWGVGYLYAWDADGNLLTGAWPGTKVVNYINDYGESEFVCNIPENAAGIVISDGRGNQSAEITDLSSYDGYWFDGTQNESGHYIPTGYTNVIIEPDPQDTYEYNWFYNTLYFEKVYQYAWDAEGNELVGEWPGKLLTEKQYSNKFDCDKYRFDEIEGAVGCIIHDGNGKQTVDLYGENMYRSFKLNGGKDSSGSYLITYCSEKDYPPPSDNKTVFITNTLNWGAFYLYAWDDEGNPLTGEWPGSNPDSITDDMAQTVFICEIPKSAAGFIVNDGNGKQSIDITDFYYYDKYWFDGTLDRAGNFIPTGISFDPPEPPEVNSLCIIDTLGWGTGYLYAWDAKGNALTGEWPGTKTKTVTNDYGENVFICEFPANAAGIIINDGNGNQSSEITDLTYDCYWFEGKKDNWGHYIPRNYDDPKPPLPEKTLRITDNFGWETGYLYAWDAQGNELTGEWPGKVTPTTINDYGENVFLCEIPYNAAGIIINDGKGNQSADITDFTYDGYWFDGTKDDEGHCVPTGYYDYPPVSHNVSVLNITDTLGWGTAYMYAWDDQGNELTGEWPGMMTESSTNEFGENEFVCNIPKKAIGIVINNGNGSQSAVISDLSSYEGYYFDGTKDDEGHYIPIGYNNDLPDPVPPNKQVLYIINNLGWENAYMYSWNDVNDKLSGAWPGTKLEKTTNDYGEEVFVCNIPRKAVGITLSDGKGHQSKDITDLSTYDGYWFDGTVDLYGKYIPTGYYNNAPEPVEFNWFYNTQNFENVYIYAWDEYGTPLAGEWPGRPLTYKEYSSKYECDRYWINEIEGAVGFIINDGETKQTEAVTDYESFMLYGKKNDEGHYLITKCSGHYVEPTDPTEPVTEQTEPMTDPVVYPENRTIEVVDSLGWGTGYMYAWDSEGNSLSGEWPGTKIENTTTNVFGETVFICNIPENAEGIVVNDGELNTSTDITDFSYDYYWFDGTMDDSGHYFATGYNYSYDPAPVDPQHSSEMYRQEFLDWSAENFGDKSLQDGYEYEELYTHKDGSDPDWVLVKARFTTLEPEPVTWLRIGGIDGRTVISGSLKAPFMFGYGIYDVKENKFYGLEEFAEKVDPVFYNREGQPLDYSKYEGLIQALTDAKVGYKTGDTNGDGRVDVLDAVAIQKSAVDKIELNETQTYMSDVNSDGAVDVLDAVEIQKYVVL